MEHQRSICPFTNPLYILIRNSGPILDTPQQDQKPDGGWWALCTHQKVAPEHPRTKIATSITRSYKGCKLTVDFRGPHLPLTKACSTSMKICEDHEPSANQHQSTKSWTPGAPVSWYGSNSEGLLGSENGGFTEECRIPVHIQWIHLKP